MGLEKGKIYFGGRGKCALQKGRLEPELSKYLMTAFNFEENDVEAHGYEHQQPYPFCLDHKSFEAMFHTHDTHHPVQSVHPAAGIPAMIPASPLEIRAFYGAFRRKNKDVFEDIRDKIKIFCSAASDREEVRLLGEEWIQVVDDVINLLGGKNPCGNTPHQIHYGHGVGGFENWHYDSKDSIFHFNVTIHGSRKVHFKVSSKKGENDAIRPIITEQFFVGDCYVGNPSAYFHGVEHLDSTYQNRSIALQSRIDFPSNVPEFLYDFLNDVLVDAYANDVFRFPSYEDVLSHAKTLQPVKETFVKYLVDQPFNQRLEHVDHLHTAGYDYKAVRILTMLDEITPSEKKFEVYWRMARSYYFLSGLTLVASQKLVPNDPTPITKFYYDGDVQGKLNVAPLIFVSPETCEEALDLSQKFGILSIEQENGKGSGHCWKWLVMAKIRRLEFGKDCLGDLKNSVRKSRLLLPEDKLLVEVENVLLKNVE
jgi:hypothetical protein